MSAETILMAYEKALSDWCDANPARAPCRLDRIEAMQAALESNTRDGSTDNISETDALAEDQIAAIIRKHCRHMGETYSPPKAARAILRSLQTPSPKPQPGAGVRG